MNILIRHAAIADGTGNPCYTADVAISGQTIADVGTITPCTGSFDRIFDADGLILAPGFIDIHSHGDVVRACQPLYAAKIRQGITTEVVGQCGLGAAPVSHTAAAAWQAHVRPVLGDSYTEWPWRSFDQYLEFLTQVGCVNNTAVLVSHGALRTAVCGMEERLLTASELAVMSSLAQQAFQAGAFGFSTGLVYAPCLFADARELNAMARVTAANNGLFAAHIRNERGGIREAIQEVVHLCQSRGAKAHISHLKVFGKENWGRAAELLAFLEDVTPKGQNLTFDQYPYAAGSTMLSALLPPYAHEGGPEALLARLASAEWQQRMAYDMEHDLPGWENIGTAAGWDGIVVTGIADGPNKCWEGSRLTAIATALGITPQQVVFRLLAEERLQVTLINFSQQEADVAAILQHQQGMLGTDGLPVAKPHPREYGSAARILGRFVRELKTLSVEQAVARMSGRPAARLGLNNRGLVRKGWFADLVLFDPETIGDQADYTLPCQHPAGIEYVLVNGRMAIDQGRMTGDRAGLVLRHGV